VKRTAVICSALLATFGIAPVGEAAKAKKVATEIEIEGVRPNFSVNTYTFVGDVHAAKTKCEKRRSVTLRYAGPDPAFDVDEVKTDRTGDFEITASTTELEGGDYVAVVDRRKLKQGDRKLTCRAATSEPLDFS
jgi:hypothetical protein